MKLPVGIQTFEKIRAESLLYVDKTKQIQRLLTASTDYYFLSRPRRFGKSLLLSTMKSIYEGRKDLFAGLWIENNWNWEKTCPVIHIKFSKADYQGKGLEQAILAEICNIGAGLNFQIKSTSVKTAFQELIQAAAEISSNGKVVVLIDEYDKPIIDYLDNVEQAHQNRNILKSFYSILKDADPYLELVFITGVSRFAKTSIFSDLNNLTNLSIDKMSDDLLGFTYEEVKHYFTGRLHEIAASKKETFESVIEQMRFWYNGYSWNGKLKVYNPFSLLQFLRSGEYKNYWFESGTPTFLIKLMRNQRIYEIENVIISDTTMSSYDIEDLNPYTLLFQTGYLTIKEALPNGIYKLEYPNNEVKISLEEYLLNAFAHDKTEMGKVTAYQIAEALKVGDVEQVIRFINATFATIPNQLWQNENEHFFHALLHLTLSLMGVFVQSEMNTSRGRLDAIVTTEKAIYILEFKLEKSATEAIEQIEKRGYFNQFDNSEKQLIGVGINFSIDKKAVNDWLVKAF